jgi:prevent-host-death family protein
MSAPMISLATRHQRNPNPTPKLSRTKPAMLAGMTRVGMHEAKTQLSRLVESARAGEEVIVERSGRAVAKIVAYDEQPRGLMALEGIWKDKGHIPDDFDELPEDIQRAFGMIDDE